MKYMTVKPGMKVRVKPDLKKNKRKYIHTPCGWVNAFMDYAGKSVTVSGVYSYIDPARFKILEDGGAWCWAADLVEPLNDYIKPLF